MRIGVRKNDAGRECSLQPIRGVTKRCRLSWLNNSALVYEDKCRGIGGGGGGGLGIQTQVMKR
jgi:hypothetical protein